MKGVSDVKLNKAIQRLLARIASIDGISFRTYEIENLQDFQAALIEQAGQMGPGEERMVYFHENVPSVFFHGYAVAKLYHHEAHERETDLWVCVDVYSEKMYYMAVKKDDGGDWHCTDLVRALTKVDYDELWNLIYDSNQYIKNHYYTSSETDQKFVPISSAGMCREFDTGAISVTEYTHPGTQSKIYTVLVKVNGKDISCMVDYRQLRDSGNGVYYYLPDTIGSLWVKITDSGVTFKMTGPDTIEHICGYY